MTATMMKLLKILIIEDDHVERRQLCERIKAAFGAVELIEFETESAFYTKIDGVLADGLDLAIVDALLPWQFPSPESSPAPVDVTEGGFWNAGARCVQRLRASPRGDVIPVIVH